jgi:2-keto-4-pentenoate hydratase
MTPEQMLNHADSGQMWPSPLSADLRFDVPAAYAHALQLRALRIARGEVPRGYKVGFTNRTIWPRYGVYAPIWGTVYDSTLTTCEGHGELSLRSTCQPRLEPEIVFGLQATPAPQASLQLLFEAIDWVAPGFEVVQSHLPDWKFQATDTIADGGLHARLLVGPRLPVRELAPDAERLDERLASATVSLSCDGAVVEQGNGANVLGSPLRALQHFLEALRACPGAPDLQAGDLVTTGTWTDAWPLAAGQQWNARFSLPRFELGLHCLT